jgi:hypothetical protein
MINRLVAPEILMQETHNLAKRLIAKNPRAVAGLKLAINAIAAVAAREFSTVQPDLFIHSEDSCASDYWPQWAHQRFAPKGLFDATARHRGKR